ncbi:MAG: polysaccharide deacetylase family protein [Flavobacteriales bacterium]|nr:polysaccharide deacetylase family protein [Flavobacteriales bacterium]
MIRPPILFRGIYRDALWTVPNCVNEIFLTFDDGPHPDITPQLIELLDEHNAKATFFLLGKNVLAYPELYEQYIEKGHAIGGHSFSHLNGWRSSTKAYLDDQKKCESVFPYRLFRPPYGKMKRAQARALSLNKKIVMWDILSKDYEAISLKKCLENVTKRIRPGSIVVFHENEKSYKKMIPVVEKLLGYIDKKEWVCRPLA